MDKIMAPLQKLGRALMGAVAVMPVAAILMGIGYWIDPEGWGANNFLAAVLINSGSAILDNLGWIFAVALAFGLARDGSGAAALSGFVGFGTVLAVISPTAVASLKGYDAEAATPEEALEWSSQGWDAINDKNVLIGILVGILAGWTYNKFAGTKLPAALAFFSGRRLVPIMMSFFSIILAGIMYFVWPLVYNVLFNFGEFMQGLGAVGAGLYGFVNRLLIPTGLHHALNSVFWFDVIGINDIGKFLGGSQTIQLAEQATDAATCPGVWDGSSCEVIGVIGQYQAGFFPVMMFGLPGAALAMYLRSKSERRKEIGSLMLAGAVASFFTGVTEPLEFSFMFVAPLLYVVHALLTGIALFIASSFDWTAGFGFSAGFVDMVLSAQNPIANKWYMLLVLGVIWFVVYFAIFYFLIGLFNLKTPGREEKSEEEYKATLKSDASVAEVSAQILRGLGGADNIESIEHCTTRLRTVTKDYLLVNEDEIKRAGVAGVIRPSQSAVQVIIGPDVQFVHDEVVRQMRDPSSAPQVGASSAGGAGAGGAAAAGVAAGAAGAGAAGAGAATATATRTGTVELASPVAGRVVSLDTLEDKAVSSGMLGEGVAVIPEVGADGKAEFGAPVAGTVKMVFKTKHAFVITSEEGLDVLVHIGMDTVSLKGEGFEALASAGDKVDIGTPIIRVNAAELTERGVNLSTPVLLPEKKQVAQVETLAGDSVGAGAPLAKVTLQ